MHKRAGKRHSAAGEQSCNLRAHTQKISQRHFTTTPNKQPRRANCLISHAGLGSYNAFKGAAATRTDEADQIPHRHKVTSGLKEIQRDKMEVEGHRSSLAAVGEQRLD